ncbi:type II toxin-antitoxin system HicA family toxin [Maricaulis maris]|nr:type II toxin-antitoxin system HicA family toxin [Maricaulis maris]
MRIHGAILMELETNSRKLIKLLEKDGFEHVTTKGSHHKYRKGMITLVVPHPKKDLPTGLVRAIYRQAGWID